MLVIEVRQTDTFSKWFKKLRDRQAKAKIVDRLKTISETGHFGDTKSVGGRISELRFFIGAGYRVYFVQEDDEIIILLAGSDKDGQKAAIKQAKEIAKIEGL